MSEWLTQQNAVAVGAILALITVWLRGERDRADRIADLKSQVQSAKAQEDTARALAAIAERLRP